MNSRELASRMVRSAGGSVLGLLALWACLKWAGAQLLEREDISGVEVLLRPCVLAATHTHKHTYAHTHIVYSLAAVWRRCEERDRSD